LQQVAVPAGVLIKMDGQKYCLSSCVMLLKSALVFAALAARLRAPTSQAHMKLSSPKAAH
jgi:hypothetical protein